MIRAANGRSVPLSQIATIRPVLEEPTLVRRDRLPALTVRGDIADGTQAPDVTAQMLPQLAPIIARAAGGLRIETGGAVEESAKGQASINAGHAGDGAGDAGAADGADAELRPHGDGAR